MNQRRIRVLDVRAIVDALFCFPQCSEAQLAQVLECSPTTIGRYRQRLRESGLSSTEAAQLTDGQLALRLFSRRPHRPPPAVHVDRGYVPGGAGQVQVPEWLTEALSRAGAPGATWLVIHCPPLERRAC